jgi:hypothetical protein
VDPTEFEPLSRLSRDRLLRRGAAVAGGAVGLGLLDPAAASAHPHHHHHHHGDRAPRPIPGGVDENFNPVASNPVWHFSFPAIGFEMATITDFHGVIAAGEVQGAAHGSDGSEWWFDCDMRFMEGKYVAVDGRLRDAAFGFV